MRKLSKLIILISSLVLYGCGGEESSTDTIKLSIPLKLDSGQYEMQTVEVPRPKSMSTLKNDFVNFTKKKPEVWVDHAAEEVFTTFSSPKFSFVKSGDTYHPSGGFRSLEAASVYYHMYKFKLVTEKLNMNLEGFWPQAVALNGAELGIKNNVGYLPMSQSVIFTDYSFMGVSGPFNASVFYHEMFHALLFHKATEIFYPGMSLKKAKYNVETETTLEDIFESLYSFNEGYADLFSFLVTGEAKILKDFYGRAGYRNFGGSDMTELPFQKLGAEDKITPSHYKNGFYLAKLFLTNSMAKLSIKGIEQLSAENRYTILNSMFEFIGIFLRELPTRDKLITDADVEKKVLAFFVKDKDIGADSDSLKGKKTYRPEPI